MGHNKFRMQNLLVKSAQGDYEIKFCEDIEEVIENINHIENSVVLIDKNILRVYQDLFSKIKTQATLILEATEENKSYENTKIVLDFLQEHRCTKSTTVIAIGGGIIQDIVAFTTHIYFRGLKWVFVPTTLLAMCDSCMGAKCGINVNEYKNQVGVFHAPVKILISQDFLTTLPDDHIQSGYGEILKHFLGDSLELFNKLETILDKEGFRNNSLLELIYLSLKFKRSVVEADEYEGDFRRILNYGHSFGHALEPLSDFIIPHGTAVAWGMDLINYIAVEYGILKRDDFLRIHNFIKKYFSCSLKQKLSAEDFIRFAKTDKKVRDGKINLVFLKEPGKFDILPCQFDDRLKATISEYLEQYNIIQIECKV